MGTSNLPLRERKKEQTRYSLFESALDLFEKQGFQATTVDQIAVLAGVSRRTFFRYFPSKEAVLFSLHQPRLERFQELLSTFSDLPSFHQIRAAFLGISDDFMQHKQMLMSQQQIILSSPSLIAYETKLDGEWETVLVETMQKNEHQKQTKFLSKITAGAIIGVIRAALRVWFEDEGQTDLVALGNEVFDMLEQGFHPSN